jgi:hypothetical protein
VIEIISVRAKKFHYGSQRKNIGHVQILIASPVVLVPAKAEDCDTKRFEPSRPSYRGVI